jgi:hypothetical protein
MFYSEGFVGVLSVGGESICVILGGSSALLIVSAPRATCAPVILRMIEMWYVKMNFIKQQRL